MKKAAAATLLSLSLLVTMNLVPLNKTASTNITALKIYPTVVDPGH
ncbi:hypothetical protein JNUCC42_12240 [Brevibacterium sp. JNUCC-42]|nr:hypothetical protein [Brevibacillus laterosporus]QOS97382.1 hypothetical protein JNUCC42_12240 [Brevibacterium sp. JNUCC-42]RAP28222.1 hypothetical protein C2W64_00434 [Brevibacillus laterosporus]